MDASVTVQEVMDRTFLGVNESDSLRETVELMVDDDAESVVVVRGKQPVGLLTQQSVLEHAISEGLDTGTVADAMTETVPTVAPDVTLSEAASELSARSTQRLVVVDGAEPVGVLSEHDLMSTSPFGPDRVTQQPEGSPVATPAGAGDDRDTSTASFGGQSICEGCGSFAHDLGSTNGQMLCPDCRGV